MTSFATDGMPLSVEALSAKMAEGWRPDFLMFWGHRAKADSGVGKHVFSQWWPAPFTLEGVRYPTAEHYMMAGKARLFGDEEMLGRILEAETPGEAKKLGRKVRNFEEAAWNAAAFSIVVRGNLGKFGQNERLKAYLLATGRRVLVEASPLDRIWGIGMGEANPAAKDPAQWRGKNLLGFALVAARAELAAGG